MSDRGCDTTADRYLTSALRTNWKRRWKQQHDGSAFSRQMREQEVEQLRSLVRAIRRARGGRS